MFAAKKVDPQNTSSSSPQNQAKIVPHILRDHTELEAVVYNHALLSEKLNADINFLSNVSYG